jgi:hypothetical protein
LEAPPKYTPWASPAKSKLGNGSGYDPAGVNFTNILQAAFFVHKIFWTAFPYLQFCFGFFWRKSISAKAARKM